MIKPSVYLGLGFIFLTSMSGVSAMQPPYGQPRMYPGMQPQSHDSQKQQNKNYKEQIKHQQKALFFQQHPGASKEAWEQYWKNYKKMNNLD